MDRPLVRWSWTGGFPRPTLKLPVLANFAYKKCKNGILAKANANENKNAKSTVSREIFYQTLPSTALNSFVGSFILVIASANIALLSLMKLLTSTDREEAYWIQPLSLALSRVLTSFDWSFAIPT